MIRDKKQEKKVRIVSWLYWKISAILYILLALAAPVFWLAEKQGWIPPSSGTKTPTFPELLLGIALYGGAGWLQWWVGRSLDRLKSWAWWWSMFFISINVLASLVLAILPFVFYFKIPGKSKDILPFFLIALMGLLVFLFYGWMIKVLAGKRGRRLFTDEYRNRLKHGSFDKFKVTPEK